MSPDGMRLTRRGREVFTISDSIGVFSMIASLVDDGGPMNRTDYERQ
jgi:hypothetical protein